MENLWAPWRMKFIEDLRENPQGCFLCEFTQAGDDRERLVLCRLAHAYVVMNRYPYNNGHLLIVPNRHLAKLVDLTDDEHRELSHLNAHAVEILADCLGAEGINCGINVGRAAGAGIIDHVHLHVVPRWNGDSNFLPVLSETRSMPEYLTDTYDRLIQRFKKLERTS